MKFGVVYEGHLNFLVELNCGVSRAQKLQCLTVTDRFERVGGGVCEVVGGGGG